MVPWWKHLQDVTQVGMAASFHCALHHPRDMACPRIICLRSVATKHLILDGLCSLRLILSSVIAIVSVIMLTAKNRVLQTSRVPRIVASTDCGPALWALYHMRSLPDHNRYPAAARQRDGPLSYAQCRQQASIYEELVILVIRTICQ